MKKTLFLLGVLLASVMTFAQTNLALTATASASGYEGAYEPANAIDGNAGTRWGSNFEGNTDTEWFQIEWTAAQTFNTVKLLCENAMNAGNAPELAFDIQTSNDGATWTTQQSVTGKNAGNGEYITVILDESVSAKFVRFQGVKKGTWGYTFFEFEVYDIDYSSQTLTSLVLPNPDKADASLTAVKVGESITISALDEHNTAMTSGFSFAATNGTITAAGVFTPSAAGLCTITATQGATVLTASVYAYAGDNLLLNLPGVTNPEATNIDLFNNGNWGDRGGLGQPADNHTWLYYDLGAYYTIDLVDLKQEQACGKNYTIQFSADGEAWTTAYTVTNEAGMAGDVRHYFYGSDQNTNVRFVRFDCTEPATGYGVSIYEIAAYGTKTADIADTEAPTAFTATLKSVGFTSATLALQATDNVSAITYTISREGAVDQVVNGASGEEVTATISGLTPGTAYEFSVVAKDAKGNAAAAVTVNASTAAWTSAAAPTEPADNVYALFSDAYTETHNFSYQVWWDGQAKQEELEPTAGDRVWHISDFLFIGSQHDQVDASGFAKLHMDVMPVGEGLTLAVTPVNADENANLYVNTKALTANQWNAVDISISDFVTAGLTMTKAFQVKLTAADGQNGTGQEFYIDNIYYVKTAAPAVITAVTVEAATTEVAVGKTLKLTVKDQDGNAVAASKLDFTTSSESVATVGADGVVTGVAEGTVTITAALKADATVKNTIELKVTPAPEGMELTKDGHTILVQAYHYTGTYNYKLIITSDEEMNGLGGSFWNVNGAGADMRDNMVLSTDKKTITIEVESSSAPNIYTPLYVLMPGEVNFGSITLEWTEVAGEVDYSVKVDGDKATVIGTVAADKVADIIASAGSVAMLDLTIANITEAIDLTGLANKNAVVIVSGTDRTPDAKGALVTATNKVVFDGTYYRATSDGITLVDEDESQPAYAFVIDAGADGVSYSRTIGAGKWVSVCVPGVLTVPEGVEVYEAVDATTSSVTFNKREAGVGANQPVVLHNTNSTDVVITALGGGDLNLTANGAPQAVNETAIMQCGTMHIVEGDGTQFALQNGNTLKKFVAGAFIGAFRVYYTGLSAESEARAIFIDGDATMIGTIKADGQIRLENAVVYDLNGRRVSHVTKGIYVVNGRKVVIK